MQKLSHIEILSVALIPLHLHLGAERSPQKITHMLIIRTYAEKCRKILLLFFEHTSRKMPALRIYNDRIFYTFWLRKYTIHIFYSFIKPTMYSSQEKLLAIEIIIILFLTKTIIPISWEMYSMIKYFHFMKAFEALLSIHAPIYKL